MIKDASTSVISCKLIFWTIMFISNAAYFTSANQNTARKGRDTYIDAYTESHGSPPAFQDFQNDVLGVVYTPQTYDTYYTPAYSSPGPHITNFYDAPSGPTSPSAPSMYGAPLKPMYGAPYAAPDPGFKGLSVGLDFATLCKILLKVLIFKMIVKFIAVICVLLFLPKLDSGSSSDGDNGRFLFFSRGEDTDDRLNTLTRVVLESVNHTSKLNINQECEDDLNCILTRVAEYVDHYSTVPRLLRMFLPNFKLKVNNGRKAR